ncbi:hypothetical protein AYO20_03255 [Fonsecaea nubica]|uniref:Uncharacterized protein n=1 Tax=Fonsecaea nubica TaxID=856822 RepID=A0A178D6L4_9EURO|nr:hypothetical protein AYO20_03255 [Fonsecaea nubica]OAL37406.1 hypothetical protein AYO20_03255 [Fonsecaea nubica]
MASRYAISGMPRSSSLTVGDKQPQVAAIQQLPRTAAFFIRSLDHPQGQVFHMVKPEDISFTPPVVLRRPPLPEARQISLQMVVPCIFFVQYPCRQKCRSLGICVHYQFVIGCRKCPDGLRCSTCVQSNVEQAIQANRKCPLHQDPTQANPINNRPEDFLATDTQKDVCDQVLHRSLVCQWDDIPTTLTTRTEQGHRVVHHGHFHRESTPRDMRDVRMLAALDEDEVMADESQIQLSMATELSACFGGLSGVQANMPRVFG